jgi:hypothetical protein
MSSYHDASAAPAAISRKWRTRDFVARNQPDAMVAVVRLVLPRRAGDAVPDAAGAIAALRIAGAANEQEQCRENKKPGNHATVLRNGFDKCVAAAQHMPTKQL